MWKVNGLESWWWNGETESAIKEKKERLKIWKRTGVENDKVKYKIAKGKAKRVKDRLGASGYWVQAILQYATPTNLKQLENFVGKLN